jgi:hypothetical protein
MKQFIGILFLLFVLTSGFFSCKKDAIPPPDLGYNYFPNQVGRYVIYNVDSFSYGGVPVVIDTFKFQIKEKIESMFTDNEGRPSIRLERYIKYYNDTVSYDSMSWSLRDVWEENVSKSTAEKVEENVRFIKLAFPINESQRWNGNAQNILGEEDYAYKFYDLARTIDGIHFDSVLQVQQHDDLTFISKNYAEEKYARNVGLIYKQMINVDSQPGSITDSAELYAFYHTSDIMQRVTFGTQYTMTIASYGTE